MRRTFGLVLAAALVAGFGVGTVVSAPRAEAAPAPGQVPVTTTPTQLLQPPDPGLGTMTPAAGADTRGMFAPQVDWPLIPIHAALAPNGRLTTYGSPVGQAAQGGLAYDDWSPGKGTGPAAHSQTASMDGYNSFCNGLSQLPDGRFLMVGGNSTMSTMLYDPATKAETMGPGLNRQRWYATVLRRPDDRSVVIGGGNYYAFGAWTNPNDNSVVATVPEIGTGTGAWQLLSGADSVPYFGAQRNRWWYPRAYNAPDGSVFGMSDDRMWRMSTTGAGSITDAGRLPIAPGVSGSSVMYDAGKILVAGGGQNANDDGVAAINGAATVDINPTTPRVASARPMAQARNWLNLTVLPNGEVLANGGTKVGTNGGASAVYPTETWNPSTGTWRTGASAARIRTYHSSTALMPSGAVFTGGGGAPGPEDNLNAEMYYPSYLFTRKADGTVGWADRGAITSIAGSLTYGGKLTLGMSDTRRIASASLIKVASVTHSVNVDQRRIPLTVAQNGTQLTTTLPTSKNVLPPGSYLLQGVDDRGVPTPSQLVTIQSNGAAGTVAIYDDGKPAATPTVPTSGTAYSIVNRTSGKPMAVAGGSTADGGKVVQQTGGGTWRVTAVGDAYTLTYVPTGKALDVNNNSNEVGLQLQQWTPNGGANQHWYLRPTGDGWFTIVSRSSGQLADDYGLSTAEGAKVVQWTGNGGANQQWRLVPG